MLGELIIKILVLVLGYAYPAIECFKSMETSRPDLPTLHFWCQYWVIIAIVTAIEKLGDIIFISWLPLYGESKLAFIIYLWHPKTKGANQVYNKLLRPFIIQHERDIEKKMEKMLMKSMDLLVFYFNNFVDKGQSLAFQVLDYILSKPKKPSRATSAAFQDDGKKKRANGKSSSWFKSTKRRQPPPESKSTSSPSFYPLTLPSSNFASSNVNEDEGRLLINRLKEAFGAPN